GRGRPVPCRAGRSDTTSPRSRGTRGETRDFARKKGGCRIGSARGAWRRALLRRDDRAKVVPLEEHVHVPESLLEKELLVLLETVRNQDVLERLSLLRDLE